MKTHEEIEKRLSSLYHKYENLYVKENLRASPDNCVHNLTHNPVALIPRPADLELNRAPRKQTTLVVLDGPARPIRICTYGSEDVENWNGDICDTVEHASQCPVFRAVESELELRKQFQALMQDDDYVFENYKDITALQWMTGHRITWDLEKREEHPPVLTVVPYYLVLWGMIVGFFRRSSIPQLPPKE